MQLASLALRYETRLQRPDYDFPENHRQVSDYLFMKSSPSCRTRFVHFC
ncbi:hypothetical protein [Paenibacillus yonginensis]|nr:hypothetical protein [Paenibacillus yonginensis]